MPDCDYCGSEFDDEDAYLDHLASEHEGELGPIERRRVERRGGSGGGGVSSTAVVVGGVALVAIVALVAVFVVGGGDGGDPAPGSDTVDMTDVDDIESASLADEGNGTLLANVEQFPSEGVGHVSSGSQIDYPRFPPLSGQHYSQAAPAGFYEQTVPLGNLVHSLEHGAVVVYYERGTLTPETKQSLQQFAQAHADPWQSVLVVPNPTENPEAQFVLTAWQHRLYMDQYEPRTVYSFLSQFLGRGPENQPPDRGRAPPS